MLEACETERLLASRSKDAICAVVLVKSVAPFLLNKDRKPIKEIAAIIAITIINSKRVVPAFSKLGICLPAEAPARAKHADRSAQAGNFELRNFFICFYAKSDYSRN